MDRVAEAARVALTGILAYAVVGTVVISVGASTFGRLFAGGPELAASETYFRWAAPSLLGFATSLVPAFVLQALKRPGLPLLAAMVRIVVLAVVALVVVPRVGAGPEWVFAAFTVGCWLEGVADLALLWLVLRDAGLDPLDRPAGEVPGPAGDAVGPDAGAGRERPPERADARPHA
jgi:Na+-driven multidrug efflux pump